MDTTTNSQPNDQLSASPMMNQAPATDLATTQEVPKDVAQAGADKYLNADVKALSGDAQVDQDAGANQDANKRDQLRRRVMGRVAEIEQELAGLEGKTANSEHATALRVELDIAKDATSGGWDHVGEMEAARLSKWLETSQPLVGKGLADPASAAAKLDPASGAPANTALPADGAVAVDGSDASVKATQSS